ncbi:MAG: hypothetical protein H0S85_00495 [Desulfovibrionaceae bacterium]|nr:hypothetical protein [Desulfovibrionaceae bacterium]
MAKVGLTAVLGVLTVTGFVRSRGARRLHLAAGAALLGLSLWHHTLYQRSGDSGGRSGGDSGGSRESGGPR